MPRANIAEIKAHLSSYLTRVERGEVFEICRRNVPIARLSPIRRQEANRTVLGSGLGTVVIHGDVTEPVLDDWEMHRCMLDEAEPATRCRSDQVVTMALLLASTHRTRCA